MKFLVLGSQGREYAYCHALGQSKAVSAIYAMPGGDAFAELPKVSVRPNPDLSAETVLTLVREAGIELVLVGASTHWLVTGLTDRLRAMGVAVIGPHTQAAQLERSKCFSRDFMLRHGLRTPSTLVIDDPACVDTLVPAQALPLVVKTDGVHSSHLQTTLCETHAQAKAAVHQALAYAQQQGAAPRALVQTYVKGWDLAVFLALDGHSFCHLTECHGYKQLDASGLGLNTCGVGCYSPVPAYNADLRARVHHDIVMPTVAGMRQEGLMYPGFLFLGIRVAQDGAPYLLEYNTRLGDPEAQCILARLQTDFATLLQAMATQSLSDLALAWDPRSALNLYVLPQGYPAQPVSNVPLTVAPGLHAPSLLWADVRRAPHAPQYTTGTGRTALLTGWGDTLHQARAQAYAHLSAITFHGMHYRSDIGLAHP